MAPQARLTHPLRMVTQKLSSTPADHLPHIASLLADALVECKSTLAAPQDEIKKGAEDVALLQKFKSQISSLLQSKSIEGRWAAVLLVKASIEIGGVELIKSVGSWVRSLVGYLGRSDPVPMKKAVIVTLTRIFSLTHGHPSTVREVTTPSLPNFVTGCLNCISSGVKNTRTVVTSSPLLKIVLQTLVFLLPAHPSIFRPFLGQIKTVLSPLLAPTIVGSLHSKVFVKNQARPSSTVIGLSQRLHALLPHCASKNGAAEQWAKAINLIIANANRTADHVLRAIVEEYTEADDSHILKQMQPATETLHSKIEDDLDLPEWTGVVNGSERLVGLLQLLQTYIATKTQQGVVLPITSIWRLATRLLSVFGPPQWDSTNTYAFSRYNAVIDREEREELWRALPKIHHTTIDLINVLIDRLGNASVPSCFTVLERLLWVFERDAYHASIRVSSYQLVYRLLDYIGPSLSKTNIRSLGSMINFACRDTLDGQHDQLQFSSRYFLKQILCTTNVESWPLPLRAAIDRVSILTADRGTMVSSALNPHYSKDQPMASILPFLAREYPSSSEVESLIRPRLPVIRIRNSGKDDLVIPFHGEDSHYRHSQPENQPAPTTLAAATGGPFGIPFTESLALTATNLSTANDTEFSKESPKRLRDDGVQVTSNSTNEISFESGHKRARISDAEPNIEVQKRDPANVLEDKGEEAVAYSAPSPMDTSLIGVPKATGSLSEDRPEDESDGNSSGMSIHLDSDLEDGDDDEDK